MGFYAKGMDGRIDEPRLAGEKGIGDLGTAKTPFHAEGGKEQTRRSCISASADRSRLEVSGRIS